MRLPQLQRPLQAACIHGGYRPVLASFALPIRSTNPTAQAVRRVDESGLVIDGRRYASVKSQGAYRIPNKKTIAKKLGAKRSGDQFVIPGNIIFKQRGTIWHAGENAIRGRDHTIHAAATGYVKYYRDPAVHPNRQFIGVAFNKEDTLPYPKNEPRQRKLGLVAHVRKAREAPRPEISDSGIPNKVLRKAGLWNIEALERRLWNSDQRRELREAKAQRAREAKAALAGLPLQAKAAEMATVTTTSAEAVPMMKTSSYRSPDDFAMAAAASSIPASQAASIAQTSDGTSSGAFTVPAATRSSLPTRITLNHTTNESNSSGPKMPFQKERTRPVTPGEFLQKSWHERRHTKVLLLNPRSYAYTESNAAIGRLSSKTMYTPPWKLGGRKSRFRSRRRQMVAKLAKAKADKELVKREKEKERLAAEAKRAAKLEKQRAKSAKAAQAGEGAGAGEQAPLSSSENAGSVQESAQPVDIKEAEKPITAQEASPSVEVKDAEKPVAAKDSEKPAETKEGNGNKPAES